MNSPVQLKNHKEPPLPEVSLDLPVMTVEEEILENYVNELKIIGQARTST